MLGLLRAEAGAHLVELHVARGKVVEHDEAADGSLGGRRVGVAQRTGEDEAELELVVERLRVRRHGDVVAVGRERQMIAHVVDRLAVPQRVRLELGERAPRHRLVGGDDGRDRGHEAAHEAARGIDRMCLIQHEIAKRARLERQSGRCRRPLGATSPAASARRSRTSGASASRAITSSAMP